MSEDQAPTPEAAPDAPTEQPAGQDAAEVAPEILEALAKAQPNKVELRPCGCGAAEPNVMIDVPNGAKIGRVTCGTCGVWGVDFLAPRTQDQNVTGAAAAKAWNEAPRAFG